MGAPVCLTCVSGCVRDLGYRHSYGAQKTRGLSCTHRPLQGSKAGFRSTEEVVENGPASIVTFPKDLRKFPASFERDRSLLEILSSALSPVGVVVSTASLVWRKLSSCGTHSKASTYSDPVKLCGLSEDDPPLMTVKAGASSFSSMFLGGPKPCTIAEMRSTADIVRVSLLAGMVKEKTSRRMTTLFVKAIGLKAFDKDGGAKTDGNATRWCSVSHDTRRALELPASMALKRWLDGTARSPLRLLAFLAMTGDNVCHRKSRSFS